MPSRITKKIYGIITKNSNSRPKKEEPITYGDPLLEINYGDDVYGATVLWRNQKLGGIESLSVMLGINSATPRIQIVGILNFGQFRRFYDEIQEEYQRVNGKKDDGGMRVLTSINGAKPIWCIVFVAGRMIHNDTTDAWSSCLDNTTHTWVNSDTFYNLDTESDYYSGEGY